ncbi:MAG: UDP-N-acetylmuramate dehydrogenase [Candidatus Moranbacteria bacterium]|nr:UDP-N-acetylmuramate dehydrogenase [Candidatus Moranbacteria bacterium]
MLDVQENIPLAPMTSFKIGGPARFYAEVKSIEELKDALRYAKERKIDYYILAGGTNLLVSDDGFEGLVIRVRFGTIEICKNKMIEVGAGVYLSRVVNFCEKNGFSGFESLAGIPGSFGGALRGNAGAYGVEIGSCVMEVSALDSDSLEVRKFRKENCDFSYRSSLFKKNKKLIVVSAILELETADVKKCRVRTSEIVERRNKKGLQLLKSAGSYFMNPNVEGKNILAEFEKESGVSARGGVVPAGWIIERAGLKGKTMGGAQVSEQHTNYIINTGQATAENVIMLVSYVKQQVRDQFGVQLVEEVNYLGF